MVFGPAWKKGQENYIESYCFLVQYRSQLKIFVKIDGNGDISGNKNMNTFEPARKRKKKADFER